MYEYGVKVLRVLDGDTIECEIDLGFNVKKTETLRLTGVDTPEKNGPTEAERTAAHKASIFTASTLLAVSDPTNPLQFKVQTAKPYDTDKYGRWLGTIFWRKKLDAPNLWHNHNADLIAGGFAKKYDGGKKEAFGS